MTGHPAPLPSDASQLACWFGDTWDAAAEAELRDLLGGCVTGVRIVLAGPEAIVRQAAALARELGALDEELVLVLEDTSGAGGAGDGAGGSFPCRVFCSTCRRPFDATGGVGDVVTCPDCNSALIVDRRFSPVHAAYYGWPSDLTVRR
ncbi:MAG TPA: dimethylamine monooxygenase subunit DmmA family protein [Trebonia sp.]